MSATVIPFNLFGMKFTLPKKYLSYSALNLWWKDKNKYRRRYYENIIEPDNAYSLFGRETHKLLEEDENLKHVPRLSKSEFQINIKIADVPIYGILDCFGPTRHSFWDFKTGIRKEDGSPRWSQIEVEQSLQLPFYSLLIEEKFGKVHPTCKLIWLETRWKQV